LFESEHTRSEGFATAARGLGVPTFDAEWDVTPAWLRVVERWREAPVAVAGLTSHTPLLLLEQSARDHGLRVVFRSEHRPTGDGTLTHLLQGPEEVLAFFYEAVVSGFDYDV